MPTRYRLMSFCRLMGNHQNLTEGLAIGGAGPRGGGPAEEGTDMLTTVEKVLPHAQEEAGSTDYPTPELC